MVNRPTVERFLRAFRGSLIGTTPAVESPTGQPPVRMTYYQDYIMRWFGRHNHPCPPTPPNNFLVCVWSFIASFIAIATLSMPTYLPSYFRAHDIPLIIGSFGASAVLIYGSVEAPLSQPRNLVLGHISSAIWGVVVNTIFNAATEDHDKIRWLSCALAVSGSIVIMQILDCVHPPGGATALIAVSGGSEIYDLGFLYIAVPVILGVVIMLGVALVFNNIQRHFPVYWWKKKVFEPPPAPPTREPLHLDNGPDESTHSSPMLPSSASAEKGMECHHTFDTAVPTTSPSITGIQMDCSDAAHCLGGESASVDELRQTIFKLIQENQRLKAIIDRR